MRQHLGLKILYETQAKKIFCAVASKKDTKRKILNDHCKILGKDICTYHNLQEKSRKKGKRCESLLIYWRKVEYQLLKLLSIQ